MSDRHFVNRQNIRPALASKVSGKLKEVNPLYKSVQIHETWENVSKENDSSLWNLLTNEDAENDDLQTNSDDDYNAQENTKNTDYSEHDPVTEALRHQTLLQNIEGHIILPEQAVNIAPGEGQIPVYHSNEENWEARAFPKLCSH